MTDYTLLLRNYRIAIATGLSKEAAKAYAQAIVKDPAIDINHLIIKTA